MVGCVSTPVTLWLLALLEDPQARDLRRTLCSIHVQANFLMSNIFIATMYFSVKWRAFLVLFPAGIMRNSLNNFLLFRQLYWLISLALFLVLNSGRISDILKGRYPDNLLATMQGR
mgnify:CR=1 FL=1